MKKVILLAFILLLGLISFSQQVPFVTKDGVVINIYKYDSAGIAAALLSKQNALSGTGFVKIIGTTISYDNNSYSTTIHGHALGSLSGVSLVSLAPNDMFVYSGTIWENKTIADVKTLWGITTVGNNLITAANPSAVRFIRINADNTVSLLDASTMLTALGGGAGGGTWGSITGTLSSQTDLQTALNGKLATGLAFLLSDTSGKTWDWGDITGKPALFLASDTAAKTWAWTDITGAPSFLTSYTETDPVVKAINGLIKSNGTVISAAIAGTDYLTPSGSAAALTSFPTFNQNTTGSAATLTTTRTLWGQNFNGSANVTGDITLGISSITMTGSIGATGARVTKGWFSDGEFTNMPTVGGISITTIAQALQNKTMTNSNNVLGGVTMTLGSDASWDMYVRNASGVLERLGNGTTGQFIGANTGAKPSWQTPAGGGGITVGTTSITGGATGKVLYDNAGVVGEIDANFTNYTSLANKDLLWYNSTTSEWNNITVATLKTEFGTPANITSLISAGTNVTITGSGTSGSPYVINSSGGGGGLTFQQELGYAAMRLF